jgi:Tol biopolymer transport system component
MPLTPGTRLGAYEIVAPLGAGGMGEVYRARDTRLGREVAIKALPDEFARDPERLGRFEREAKLLASLNHPNIGAIYGLEVVEGHRYLVLEFIEGETLGDLIRRGPVPVGEAVELCAHVAAALESAHESGIVHRDLKPANVMLTRTGAVKVVDFGLAKGGVFSASDSDPALSASPTMTYGATQAGMVLGTAAYMSPEQARGKAVDKRTDIWSFGCVLYESLTGKQAFEGETVSDLIAHILTSEPDWNALPPTTPPRVRELLRRCLEKDARRRLRDMGDARNELEETLAPRGSSSMAIPVSVAAAVDASGAGAARKKSRVRLEIAAAIVGALAGVVATRLVGPMLSSKAPARPPVRFQVTGSDSMQISRDGANAALSPDGTMLAFVAGDSIANQLWVRPLASLVARPLAGTKNAVMPFWSPDGKHIAFFTESKLKRIATAGGDLDELADVKNARGGAWNAKDQILFAPTSDGPLFVIPAGGGDARQVTTLDTTRGETGHRFPSFLPDGRHFLFAALPPRDGKFTIRVGQIDGGKTDSVAALPSGVRYAAPGYLLYQNNLNLMALPFSASSHKVKGPPASLREGVNITNYSGAPGITVTDGRALAFPPFVVSTSRLVWCDPSGREIAPLPFEPAQYLGDFQFSPDGKSVALTKSEGAFPLELWIGDVERGVMTPFAQEPLINTSPRWSPDGALLAYMHSSVGPQHFVVRSVRGTEPPRSYFEADPSFKQIGGWSPDGTTIIYDRQAAATRWDLYLLDVATGKTRSYQAGPYNEQSGTISPDGKWVMYISDKTGRPELFVTSYPTPGVDFQVTTSGAIRCAWLPGGKKITFTTVPEPFAAKVADVLPTPDFRIGPVSTLLRIPTTVQGADITKDGRVAIQLPVGAPPPTVLTVVLDWAGALRGR